jgi:hypothetical protein
MITQDHSVQTNDICRLKPRISGQISAKVTSSPPSVINEFWHFRQKPQDIWHKSMLL